MTSLILLSVALAQPPANRGDEPVLSRPLPSTKLTLSPAAAPVPAFRYELLPPARIKSPGNAVVGFYRAAMLRPSPPKTPGELQKQNDREEAWLETPIAQLATEPIKEYLKAWDLALRELDDAARYDRCDWQQAGKLKPENINALLSPLTVNRELVHYLTFRTRVEIAENRFDDAVYSLQTGLQTGKYVTEGPSMIQGLVGLALTQVMLARVEEFVQRPGAPNLYWSLAALPHPLLDPRPVLDGEYRLITAAIPNLADLEKGPVPAETADKVFDAAMNIYVAERGGDNPFGKAGKAVYLTFHHAVAKKALVDRGWKSDVVEKMPAAQAVLLRTAAIYREYWDEQAKLFFVPQPFARAEFAKVRDRMQAVRKDGGNDPLLTTFSLVYPAVERVYVTFAQTERRLAALQVIEAIRLHLAATGKLPDSLNDVTVVPVPGDPGTGKAFAYALVDGTATLSGPAPAGQDAAPHTAVRYELRLRTDK